MTGQEGAGSVPEQVDDCANALTKLYAFLDQELAAVDADDIRRHLVACEPCLDAYDTEEALRQLVKRGCGGVQAPDHLKAKVMGIIQRSVTQNGITTETTTSFEVREY